VPIPVNHGNKYKIVVKNILLFKHLIKNENNIKEFINEEVRT